MYVLVHLSNDRCRLLTVQVSYTVLLRDLPWENRDETRNCNGSELKDFRLGVQFRMRKTSTKAILPYVTLTLFLQAR